MAEASLACASSEEDHYASTQAVRDTLGCELSADDSMVTTSNTLQKAKKYRSSPEYSLALMTVFTTLSKLVIMNGHSRTHVVLR